MPLNVVQREAHGCGSRKLRSRMDAVRLTFALLALLLAVPATAGAHSVGSLDLTAQLGYHSDPVGSTPDRMVTAALSYAEAADGLPMTWCGDERTTDDTANAVSSPSAARVKVIYAYASDRPNRFDRSRTTCRRTSRCCLATWRCSRAGSGRSGSTWARTAGPTTSTSRRSRSRGRVPPTSTAARRIFHLLDADVRAVVEAAYPGRVDWMVYADDMRPGSTSGTGQIYYDGPFRFPEHELSTTTVASSPRSGAARPCRPRRTRTSGRCCTRSRTTSAASSRTPRTRPAPCTATTNWTSCATRTAGPTTR